MADAVAAAKDRIDRAIVALERRMRELKTPPRPVSDDDLFAPLAADQSARVAELEAAGRDALEALSEAADEVRRLMDSPPADTAGEG